MNSPGTAASDAPDAVRTAEAGVRPSHDAGETPDRPVAVYDGECGFCRAQVARMRRWGGEDRFEFLTRQDPTAEERFPVLREGDFDTGMRLIETDGRVLVGADAVHAIARRLPRTAWIAWIYRVPVLHALFRWAYAWVAANRQRLGKTCDDGLCALPPDPKREDT